MTQEKKNKPLSGKEIIEAAKNSTKVLYVYTPFDPLRFKTEVRAVPTFSEDKKQIVIEEDVTGFCWEVDGLEAVDSYYFGLDTGDEAIYCENVLTTKEAFKEKLAKFIHEDIWAHWMQYLFSKCEQGGYDDWDGTMTISADDYVRWERQMNTNYEDLPEDEKKSDRELAEKLMKLLEEGT